MDRRAALSIPLALLGACSTPPAGPEIVAHRGASLEAPENTLAAIERAIELGADRITADVRVTQDGVVVLFSDDELERTTDGTGLLEETSFAELRALDAGSWKDARFTGERVPTLEEGARACAGRARMFLEVKVEGHAAAILAALRAAGIPERDVIAGLWHDPQLRVYLPQQTEVTLAFIGRAPKNAGGSWLGLLHWTGFRALALENSTVTPRVLNAARARYMPVYVWGLDAPEAVDAALSAGVAGIVTDDPALLARWMEELRAKQPDARPRN